MRPSDASPFGGVNISLPYKVQDRIGAFSRVRVFPMRATRYAYLKLRFLTDAYRAKGRGAERRREIGPVQGDWRTPALWREFLRGVLPVLGRLRPEPNEKVLEIAEEVMRHRFSILGKTYEENGNEVAADRSEYEYKPIHWNLDPGSGYRWSDSTWYRDARKNLPHGTDIKMPWELSRCHHLITLGEAYLKFGDARYAKEYRNQILDWIASNPLRYGPNWACTMDVGIRAANWSVSLLYFLDAPEMDDAFLNTIMLSLEQHGRHIKRNLENISTLTSNHYAANIAGLYVLALLCPVLKLSTRWRAFAKKELEKEILRQSYEDGWQFEASTCYHKLVTEMMLYSFVLGEFQDDPFSDQFDERLRKMLGVLAECAKPDGTIPQVGDNDSGRFLGFRSKIDDEELDIAYLIKTALMTPRISVSVRNSDSKYYPQAGRAVFRSKRIYLMVIAGPKGQAGLGGHAHNDVLSYELNVDGRDVFVDPGTYAYTGSPDDRNRFRSVSNHTTLYWPGIEPCSLTRGLFLLPEEGKVSVECCSIHDRGGIFSAIYKWKDRFHRRRLKFDGAKDCVFIEDACSHEGAMLSFVCAPGIEPIVEERRFLAGNVEVCFAEGGINSMKVEISSYSPGFGRLIPNKIVRVPLVGSGCTHWIQLK